MAILLVNKDGTSNAKAGDYVVTGGGIYQKNADGSSTKVAGLPNTATGSSKNYNDVVSAFSSLVGSSSSGGSVTSGTDTAHVGTTKETASVDDVDDNGIAKVTVAGYDPSDYAVYSSGSSGSSTSISTVLGYVILGLIGVALLDRFMNGGGKRG
jgi:hypothetical protein